MESKGKELFETAEKVFYEIGAPSGFDFSGKEKRRKREEFSYSVLKKSAFYDELAEKAFAFFLWFCSAQKNSALFDKNEPTETALLLCHEYFCRFFKIRESFERIYEKENSFEKEKLYCAVLCKFAKNLLLSEKAKNLPPFPEKQHIEAFAEDIRTSALEDIEPICLDFFEKWKRFGSAKAKASAKELILCAAENKNSPFLPVLRFIEKNSTPRWKKAFETGENCSFEALEEVLFEREEKIENYGETENQKAFGIILSSCSAYEVFLLISYALGRKDCFEISPMKAAFVFCRKYEIPEKERTLLFSLMEKVDPREKSGSSYIKVHYKAKKKAFDALKKSGIL